MGHNVLCPAPVWYHGHCPLFLCTKFELAPSVNFHQMWVGAKCVSGPIIFLHEMSEYAQCEYVPNVSGHQSLYACTKLVLFFNVYLHPLFLCHEISECTQCECAPNVRVHPIWMCTKCQCAQCEMAPNVSGFWVTICMHLHLVFFSVYLCPLFFCMWLFLHPNFQSAPMWILACHFCAQIVSVCQMWIGVAAFFCWLFLHPKFQSAPNVNVHEMSECTQFECAPNVSVPMWNGTKCEWVLSHYMYASAPGIFQCVFVPIIFLHVVISVPKFSECAQCKCTTVATFFSLSFLCPNCQCCCLFSWLILHPNFQCAPNVNVLVLPPS